MHIRGRWYNTKVKGAVVAASKRVCRFIRKTLQGADSAKFIFTMCKTQVFRAGNTSAQNLRVTVFITSHHSIPFTVSLVSFKKQRHISV
jgi:hypothetical protein